MARREKKRSKSEKASKQGDVRDEQLSSGTVFPFIAHLDPVHCHPSLKFKALPSLFIAVHSSQTFLYHLLPHPPLSQGAANSLLLQQ